MGLKLDQSLVGHSYLCTSIAPGDLAGIIGCVAPRFCGCVGVPIPLLEALPSYRRWSLQAVFSSSLVLARVVLIESWEVLTH